MKTRILLCLVTLSLLTACAAFRNPDGSINTAKTDAAAASVGATATTFGSFFGPLGTAIGLGVAGVATAWAAKLKGESTGYADGHLDATGKSLASEGGPIKPPVT